MALFRSLSPKAFALAVALAIVAASSHAAAATTIWVANNGDDYGHCGAKALPCRTIGHALALAANGDTIQVGPGHYGDLRQSGGFNSPGDEPFLEAACLICIHKSVNIYAVEDAATTFIDVGGADYQGPLPEAAVAIYADGAHFGSVGHGFSVRGYALYGIEIDRASAATVAGNTVYGAAQIYLPGGVNTIGFRFIMGGGRATVSGNTAIGCETGFDMLPASPSGPAGTVYFSTNKALNNTLTGVHIEAGSVISFDTNTASGNHGSGLWIAADGVQIKRALLDGNYGGGILAAGNQLSVLYSTIVGNGAVGVYFVGSNRSTSAGLHNNNIYGNDENSGGNCGVANDTGSRGLIKATQNYWGAASGPGANPADAAGTDPLCNRNGSNVVVAPFATVAQ